MKKAIMFGVVIVIVLLSVGIVFAGKTQHQKPDKVFALPDKAVEVSPGVFYLGKSLDKGRVVEGYAMFVKPGTVCGNGICEPGENARKCPEDCSVEDPEEPDTSSCYEFLARGAKWKTIEPYLVDPANDEGLGEQFITNNLATSIEKWEVVANFDILGNEASGIVDGADFEAPDNKNEVYFSNLGETNTIAFAVVWGIFGGPPPFRELVEWDMVFNDAFTWGDAEIDSSFMDFENIATHELGHAVGLADLYTTKCNTQTMYGYSDYGEISKRSLESGDIAGIQALYN